MTQNEGDAKSIYSVEDINILVEEELKRRSEISTHNNHSENKTPDWESENEDDDDLMFKKHFKDKHTEEAYISKMLEFMEKVKYSLNDVVLICVSGVYGSGKDTFSNMLKSQLDLKLTEKQHEYDFFIDTIAFANPLKDALSSVFDFDRSMFSNDTEEKREWMTDIEDETALFWSSALLRSNHTGYNFTKFYSSDNMTSPNTELKKSETFVDDSEKDKFNGLNDPIIDKIPFIEEKELTLYAQFRDSLKQCHRSGELSKSLIPFNPRNACEFIGGLFREKICEDVWVLSLIHKIYLKEKERDGFRDFRLEKEKQQTGDNYLKKKKKLSLYIVMDARQKNEIVLPINLGLKVIYIHIRRQELLNKTIWYESLQKFLVEGTVDSDTHPVTPPTVDNTLSFMMALCSKSRIRVEPQIRWMPIWLQHYMRAMYGPHLYEFNKLNGKDVVYIDVKNEEGRLDLLRERASYIVSKFIVKS